MAPARRGDPFNVRLEWPSDPPARPARPETQPADLEPADPRETGGAAAPAPAVEVMPAPLPAAGLELVANRIDALSHSTLAAQSVLADRLERQQDRFDRALTEIHAALERQAAAVHDLADALNALRREQRQLARSAGPAPPALPARDRVDAVVTGCTVGWERFRARRAARQR
jgi:hypothetical protein